MPLNGRQLPSSSSNFGVFSGGEGSGAIRPTGCGSFQVAAKLKPLSPRRKSNRGAYRMDTPRRQLPDRATKEQRSQLFDWRDCQPSLKVSASN
jgi:hypothetical protein